MPAIMIDGRECPRSGVPRRIADEIAEVIGSEANRFGTAADVAVIPRNQDLVDEVIAVQPKINSVNI